MSLVYGVIIHYIGIHPFTNENWEKSRLRVFIAMGTNEIPLIKKIFSFELSQPQIAELESERSPDWASRPRPEVNTYFLILFMTQNK